jgi:hypothetical protein
MLDPDMPFVERMRGPRDVADRVDVRVTGPQSRIDDNPVVHVETGGLGELRLGNGPHGGKNGVGGDLGAVREQDPTAVLSRVRISASAVLNRKSTPCWRCSPAKTRATSGPSTRSSGSSADSTTVTATPAARAAALISRPIQPAPITTRWEIDVSARPRVSESSRVRR